MNLRPEALRGAPTGGPPVGGQVTYRLARDAVVQRVPQGAVVAARRLRRPPRAPAGRPRGGRGDGRAVPDLRGRQRRARVLRLRPRPPGEWALCDHQIGADPGHARGGRGRRLLRRGGLSRAARGTTSRTRSSSPAAGGAPRPEPTWRVASADACPIPDRPAGRCGPTRPPVARRSRRRALDARRASGASGCRRPAVGRRRAPVAAMAGDPPPGSGYSAPCPPAGGFRPGVGPAAVGTAEPALAGAEGAVRDGVPPVHGARRHCVRPVARPAPAAVPPGPDNHAARRQRQADRLPVGVDQPPAGSDQRGPPGGRRRGRRDGGPQLLPPPRRRPDRDPPGRGQRSPRSGQPAGRVDVDPAVRQERVPRAAADAGAQGQGGDAGAQARADADQAADPRALPEHHLLRPGRVRHPGRIGRLLRQGRPDAHPPGGRVPGRGHPRAGVRRPRA